IIMTSNIGSDLILEHKGKTDKIKSELMQLMHAHFRPEFLNRVDETLIFHTLDKKDIRQIVDIQLAHFTKRLAEQDVSVTVSGEAKNLLAEKGYDPVFGARPLKRTIVKELETPVSRLLVAGDILPNTTLKITAKDKELKFN
ncbi:MAG: AAA family ATPase, partial [Victivallaceae bacterium]|nr:AAA family ATPase [Victivallaceae bacterium]